MKTKRTAFTVVELITVLGIIAILVAILLPSVNMIHTRVKTTQQKSQFNSIGMALEAFRSDYGDYPPSENIQGNYTGAEKLAEAMFGRDLRGFHPETNWDATDNTYYPAGQPSEQNLQSRKPLYLDPTNVDVYSLGDIFGQNLMGLNPDNHVICDVFGAKRIDVGNSDTYVTVGTPILYFKANTSLNRFANVAPENSRYNRTDNEPLTNQNFPRVQAEAGPHQLANAFYNRSDDANNPYRIRDPRITTDDGWPRRPDSFILISAGPDGIYGTEDDIFNF